MSSTDHRLDVPGATLAFDLVGDEGPAVVALHGLTSSRRREAALGLDVGSRLETVRLLRYDARGHGGSTGRQQVQDFTWPRLADDLHVLLEHVFGGEVVHGIGASMGAATLLHAALSQPRRFDSLSLLVPPTAWGSRAAQADTYEAAARLVETSGVDAWMAAGADDPQPPATAGRPDTQPDVEVSLLPTVLRGAASSDLPARDAVAQLDVPTLVLAWTDDPAHPLTTVDALTTLLPDCRAVVTDDPVEVRRWGDQVGAHVAAAMTTTPLDPLQNDPIMHIMSTNTSSGAADRPSR